MASDLMLTSCRVILHTHVYSPFHKTLPRSSLKMHLISVKFYEMGGKDFLPLEKNERKCMEMNVQEIGGQGFKLKSFIIVKFIHFHYSYINERINIHTISVSDPNPDPVGSVSLGRIRIHFRKRRSGSGYKKKS